MYLPIIHLLKSSTCFEHYPVHVQQVYVVIVYMQPLVSSVCAGDCLVHRLMKNSSSFLTGVQGSHLQRVTIPEAAYIQLRRRPSEDKQSARNMSRILINVLYINKQEFCASSWKSTKVILWCTVNQSSIFPRIQGTRSYTEEFNVGPRITKLYVLVNEIKIKATPLQPWTGPESSRRMRLPYSKTIGTWRW